MGYEQFYKSFVDTTTRSNAESIVTVLRDEFGQTNIFHPDILLIANQIIIDIDKAEVKNKDFWIQLDVLVKEKLEKVSHPIFERKAWVPDGKGGKREVYHEEEINTIDKTDLLVTEKATNDEEDTTGRVYKFNSDNVSMIEISFEEFKELGKDKEIPPRKEGAYENFKKSFSTPYMFLNSIDVERVFFDLDHNFNDMVKDVDNFIPSFIPTEHIQYLSNYIYQGITESLNKSEQFWKDFYNSVIAEIAKVENPNISRKIGKIDEWGQHLTISHKQLNKEIDRSSIYISERMKNSSKVFKFILNAGGQNSIKETSKEEVSNKLNFFQQDTEVIILEKSHWDTFKKVGGVYISADKEKGAWSKYIAPKGASTKDFLLFNPKNIQEYLALELFANKDFGSSGNASVDIQNIFDRLNLEMPVGGIVFDGKKRRVNVYGQKKTNNKGGMYSFTGGGNEPVRGGVTNFYMPGSYQAYNEVKENLEHYGYTDDEKRKFGVHESARRVANSFLKTKTKKLKAITSALSKRDFLEAKGNVSQHFYIKKKRIRASKDIRVDRRGTLLIPFNDVNGNLQSLQRIYYNKKENRQEKLTVKFRSKIEVDRDAPKWESAKSGCMHLVGRVGEEQVSDLDVVFLAEGYATASSASEALGVPVLMGIDTSNMEIVAKLISELYPDKKMIVIADNDIHKVIAGQKNPELNEKQKENSGLIVARKIKENLGIPFIELELTEEEIAEKLSDANDIHVSRGISGLRRELLPKAKALGVNFEKSKTNIGTKIKV